MTIPWPSALVPARCNPNLRNFSASGGRTFTGREQRVFSDAGFWIIDMQRIAVTERRRRYAYDVLLSKLRQGESVIVPIFDQYAAVGVSSPGSSATMSANAALRETTIGITVSGIDVQPGVRFSIGARLHLITDILSGPDVPPLENQAALDSPWSDETPWVDAVSQSAAYSVKIIPPLRADTPSGTALNFATPALICVPLNIQDGDLDLDIGRYGFPSMTFVESID